MQSVASTFSPTVPSVLGDLLTTQPATAPALFLPSESASLNYGQLASCVQALTQELTVQHGQPVALALPNGVELVLAFFAVATLGAVVCPFNPGYTQSEFEFYLNDTKPALLLVPRGFLASNPAPPCVSAARKLGVQVKEVVFNPASALRRLPSFARPRVHPDDVALILHTSGTTGRPKAVPLTHDNLLVTARNIVRTYTLSPADNTYLVQRQSYLADASPSRKKFDPSKTWGEFQRSGCTWITAVPSILQMLLHAPAPDGLKMRFIRSCSSPLSPSTLEQLETRFGVPVLEAYAMTEAAHQMTSNPLPPLNAPRGAWKRKPGSVGIAQGTEIAIYDGATPAAPGQHGDVCVRSKSVTKGYMNNAAANADAFLPNGFFRTGDRGFLDPDGYLTLVGRNSEIINRGGEKISPIEVDAALLGCSPAGAIREAACFAVPDALMGQEVEAAVVLDTKANLDEASVQGLVRRVLADFKVPKRIHFVEGAIPKGPTGKIQRKNLAEVFGKKNGEAGQTVPPPQVGETVKAVLADLLHIAPSAITDRSTLFELGADSITFIRLVSALRTRGISVSAGDLFANPSVGELVRLIQHQKGEEPDPRPFELLGCTDAAADIATQLGVQPEEVEDAFPLIRNQALMYRGAMKAPNTNTWFVGDMVKLNDKVDVERWVKVWNTVFENESCLRGTLVGRLNGQDQAHTEAVNTAYLSPRALAPHWVRLQADSRSAARAAIETYAAALRHSIGMRSVHFVLAAYPTGTIFALLCAHIFLDAGSREMVQDVASALYHRPGTVVKKQGCAPWARYVKYALSLQTDDVFWGKDLAPSAQLPPFHTVRFSDPDAIVQVRKKYAVLDLPLGDMSAQLGVSVPLLAESAFCLALSLYWSQVGGKMEPAFYGKALSRRYEEVKDMFDIRGLPFQMNTALIPVATASHSLWAFVNSFMHKMRAVEPLEQSLQHAQPQTAIAWLWRLQRQVPEWDALTSLIDGVWRPTCPTELSMRRVGPTKLMVYQIQEVWFADEFKQRGCELDLLDIATRTLAFFAQGGLECKTYEDLRAAVFDTQRETSIRARL
ncbi:putative peroxisomal-coenzyme A synthetase [Mycena venus]|uniref:Putative peroxisomal-coenzyme A synthetase n=1 Tax=Mycena venus TaxID=2733690 RepID=A0A8H6XD78_9AGAR|nr:putative peroxisomal-coenzyme A synthetase [Mycena venus]